MNTICPSLPSGLQLALQVTSNHEWSDAPETAYLLIDARQAQAILDLMGLTKVFREQATRVGLVSRWFTVSVGSGEMLPDFRLLRIPFDEGEAPDSDRPVVRLPGEFDAASIPDGDEHRVECHRIEVDDSDVRFTALLRHGSNKFTTAELDRELIQTIADGRIPGAIPAAKLTATNFN